MKLRIAKKIGKAKGSNHRKSTLMRALLRVMKRWGIGTESRALFDWYCILCEDYPRFGEDFKCKRERSKPARKDIASN
jgi:hypothetical protein